MRKFWRLYWLMRRLQQHQAFISLRITNFRVQFEYWDGGQKRIGDEYTARRVLNTLKENDRRGLEWAEEPYPSSGPIVVSKPE